MKASSMINLFVFCLAIFISSAASAGTNEHIKLEGIQGESPAATTRPDLKTNEEPQTIPTASLTVKKAGGDAPLPATQEKKKKRTYIHLGGGGGAGKPSVD